MACTRGCTGTPICSALDLCCIQFRQDCGKECDGVPSGYSTIQLNVDGELELCSNVGGVCTCEVVGASDPASILTDNADGTATHDDGLGVITVLDICQMVLDGGCTDVLVDNADGTATHTAVDGVIVTLDICEMFREGVCAQNTDCIQLAWNGDVLEATPILSPDDCNGLECRENGLYLNNDIQTVAGNAGQNQQALGTPGAQLTIGGGGAWQELGNDATVTITNPSLCNEMDVCVTINGVSWGLQNLTGSADAQVQAGYGFEIDGGGLLIITQTTSLWSTPLSPYQTLPAQSITNCDLPPLAPGASTTWRIQPAIRIHQGTFTGVVTINSFNININGTNYIF